MNWSVGKKIGAGFCVPLVALVCIGIAGYRTTDRLLENSRWVTHTEIVLRELEAIISHLRNIQLGQRDYLITADDSVLQPFEAAVTGLTQQVDALRGETRDNPKQQQRLDELAPIIAQRIETARKSIELRRSTSFEEARQEFEKHAGRKFTTDILRIVADMEAEENALLKVRTDETNAAAASAKLSIV
ncbi:MAG: CHASE3 domain-containing protein, partial [Verrucomicrobia bacterium]|nr:CHASE3 domain-containing protein [Verrucomicrobiota bacterium]